MNKKGWLFLAAAGYLLVARPGFANPVVAEKLSAGVWRSLVAGGTNLYDFPLTPVGRERFESFPLDRDPALRCEPPGMPRAFYYLSPMGFSFADEEVTIRYETMDVVRTVHIDGEPLPASAPHTPNGYSTGYWDGDTLVVDTSHLAAGETVREGVPKSDLMTLQERIRVEDRSDGPTVSVAVTITDPENFAESFTTTNEFALEPDWELLPFECHDTEYQ